MTPSSLKEVRHNVGLGVSYGSCSELKLWSVWDAKKVEEYDYTQKNEFDFPN